MGRAFWGDVPKKLGLGLQVLGTWKLAKRDYYLLLVLSRVESQKYFTWCNRDICKFILSFTLSLGLLSPPLTPLLVVLIK
jgi:hypothetical protein